MDGVGGMCGLWVVLCVGCVLHGLLIPSLCPHQTTTTLPFSSPFTTPLFCLCLSVWKRGWTRKWMVWNGVWCVACNTSATVLSSSHHQPLCVSRPSPFPSHSQTPSLLPSFLVCFGLVWTERVKDKCGTHHVKHTVHHIQSTPHSFHPITPLFNEHMVDWFVMHQNTFHTSMVVCPLLMHKPFPPHSCFAIPFHHSTHQPPLLFSFSLSHSIPFHNTHAMPSFNTLSLHPCAHCDD